MALFLFCVFVTLRDQVHDLQHGGNAWKQGDWLINTLAGPVRRGIMGAWLVGISDRLGVSPLGTVILLQSAIYALLAGLAALLALRQRDGLFWILMLSPGFFIVQWAGDPQGAMRKEMFSYLAVLLLLGGAAFPRLSQVSLLLAVLAMGLGLMAHEANLFLIPTFLACLLALHLSGRITLAWMLIAAVPIVILGIFVLGFTLAAGQAGHPQAICQTLVDRGLDPEICSGAIAWVDKDLHFAVADARSYLSARVLGIQIVATLLAFAPIFYVLSLLDERRRALVALAIIVLPISALFPIAHDWGRFLSMQVTAVCFLIMLALQVQLLQLRAAPGPWVVLLLIGQAIVWSPEHMFGFKFHF